ncbi:MAG TPA: hypothetical protein VGD88_13750 [Opitutaceae bacterium]
MKSQRTLVAGLALALAPWAAIRAQSDIPIQFLTRDTGWTISVGMRASSKLADVKFGNLGTVPPGVTVDITGNQRVYDNGQVFLDAARSTEKDTNGNVTTTPFGRYQLYLTNTEGNQYVAGDFVAYSPGYTREWAYATPDQVTSDGRIGMSIFSAKSEGAGAAVDGDSGGGVEVSLGRRIGKIGNKIEWGINGSIGLTDFNRKTSGRIRSTLTVQTDYYRVYGGVNPDAPYTASSFRDLVDSNGVLVTPNGYETTTLLNETSTGRETVSTAGAAVIDGDWKIKGSYYIMRVGPSLRAHLSERIAFSFSAGFAGAYVGSTYTASESLQIPGASRSVDVQEEEDASEFIAGYYAEALAEFWFTRRTGIYAGVTYERFGEFEQVLGSRTAEVDIGGSAGFRLGITTRF